MNVVLEVSNLIISHKSLGKLVGSISLKIHKGETVALVGRSGSGKSLTAQAILGLFFSKDIEVTSGKILLEGQEISTLPFHERRKLLGRHIALIPQNPLSALNPTCSIGKQLIEAGVLAGKSYREAQDRAFELLERVGFQQAALYMLAIPSQLSGGMRQRVLIAMALMNNPKLIVADEPTTALDVTVQAQTLDLMESLQNEYGIAFLFITHDLGVVARIAHRAIVLDRGEIVEEANIETLFSSPKSQAGISLLEAAEFCYKRELSR